MSNDEAKLIWLHKLTFPSWVVTARVLKPFNSEKGRLWTVNDKFVSGAMTLRLHVRVSVLPMSLWSWTLYISLPSLRSVSASNCFILLVSVATTSYIPLTWRLNSKRAVQFDWGATQKMPRSRLWSHWRMWWFILQTIPAPCWAAKFL